MYFKRINMHGFKSFADPTSVNIEQGVTAIVGPNGCGKSNILDALRWALGEQSARELRGSHMQDVIFNGSDRRPPTGMAEVSLTFDNVDGQLPVDYSEVEVTRRVYRSGESEYLLNKTGCRLRDIQELFMDTGIGTNAYSLIGQGKIDLVLSTKPEDRRYLLEEAAGIIKYKTRKRTALRKLESAEQNMLRLNDIIAEVERQMRSLKRQVNAAIRHRELTNELRSLEIRNAWLRYNELSGQVADLREKLTRAVDQYQEQAAKTTRQEAEIETINLKRVETDRLMAQRREQEYTADAEMERLENQVSLFKQEVEFARERRAEALAEKERLEKQAESINDESGVSAERLGACEKEVGEIQSLLAREQQRLDAARTLLTDKEVQLENLRGMTLESVNIRNRAQTELETVGVSMANVEAQAAAAAEQQALLRRRLQEFEALVAKVREEERQLQAQLDAIHDRYEEARKSRRNVEAEMASLNHQWQELREQRSRLEARLNSLVELRDSYEGFAVGVRAVMMAKQHEYPGMAGIIGPVGDVIATDKQYEYAIEAALGGNINNVIVDTADAAKSAITFLKENRAGRVTFLPLDTIRPGRFEEDLDLSHKQGIIGLAVDYVQCEERLLPAIQYLLYNTLIVESIDDAIRIARHENRFPRLVTLEGEVVTPAGAVTGGRTRHESHGLLGRAAEIEELESKVEQAGQTLERMVARTQELKGQTGDLAKVLERCETEIQELRLRLNERGMAAARHAAEADSQRTALEQNIQTTAELERQRKEFEEKLQNARTRVGGMENDDETLRRNLETEQQEVARCREELNGLNAAVADLRVRETEALRALEELKRDYDRSCRGSQEARELAEKQLRQAGELDNRILALEEQIKSVVGQSAGLSQSRDKMHSQVLETQREQHFLAESADKLTHQLKDSRARTDSLQREVHKIELECSQKEDRMQFFQERISVEYGLALASLTEEQVGMDDYDEKEREALIEDRRQALQRIGSVNLGAIEEYDALEGRAKFLNTQNDDLVKARDTLLGVVKRIDAKTQDMFLATFEDISNNFKNHFRRLFNGGQARLFLLDEANPLECGIEIEARPPGKKPQTISLLSGGEQAMTAIALLFSIFVAKPSPFCVLDEVDAPLDDANIGRFLEMVGEFTEKSQFIMITHNKQTMARANAIFGVTQQEQGISQVVSVRLEEAEKVVASR